MWSAVVVVLLIVFLGYLGNVGYVQEKSELYLAGYGFRIPSVGEKYRATNKINEQFSVNVYNKGRTLLLVDMFNATKNKYESKILVKIVPYLKGERAYSVTETGALITSAAGVQFAQRKDGELLFGVEKDGEVRFPSLFLQY